MVSACANTCGDSSFFVCMMILLAMAPFMSPEHAPSLPCWLGNSHADSTWKDIVREDNSTNHVAAYDIDTGELIETGSLFFRRCSGGDFCKEHTQEEHNVSTLDIDRSLRRRLQVANLKLRLW